MLLSPGQQQSFWRTWAAIVRGHNWTTTEAEEQRRALLKRAGFSSLTKVDKTSGFDRVLAELGALRDNLARAHETIDTTIGEARRLRHIIRTELLPCLAIYLDLPSAIDHGPSPTGQAAAESYLQEIVSDLVRWNKTDRPTRPPTLEDLDARPIVSRSGPCHTLRESPSQIAQAMMTLNARLHTKRKEAGHSIHDMKTLAGLPCHCRLCTRPASAVVLTAPGAEPVRDLDPANAPW